MASGDWRVAAPARQYVDVVIVMRRTDVLYHWLAARTCCGQLSYARHYEMRPALSSARPINMLERSAERLSAEMCKLGAATEHRPNKLRARRHAIGPERERRLGRPAE